MNEDEITPLLDAVRRLVDEKLIPAEAQIDREHRIPDELLDLIREMGLFAYAIPSEHGGLGLSKWAEVRMIFEFCRAAPAYRSYVGTTNGVGGKSIVLDGTEAQKRRYLPAIAAGELIVSFCLTEPGSGSDAKSLATTALRDGDHYVLNGSKRFISNAPVAGLFTVMARTDPGDKSAAGVSAFLVEAGTPGLHVDPPLEKMGQLGAPTADVTFTDCRVPADALLGAKEGLGFITAMKVLDDARIHMGAVSVGLATRLVEEMTAYAVERQQFGQPIADFQLVQAMIADSEAECLAARAMVEQTAHKMDAGGDVIKDAAACKYFASETAGRIADRAVQVHGGYGYMRETAVERLYRDARLLRIFEGTSQIMQLVIAREALKEYRAAH
ncbi:MAG: acyl-CoA dehydrogenase family protein [Alphaproteobacteria bacterium]|jgi:acyl-CoA dehydrogenase|nr:acyl-CoA dehydrogenase family protein [Alphaproteobacteria bacterium]MDP6830825.1 acyl-CoA dehydrogenase family protein [Alphaproteobacteria bacterium]MDP6872665.1 acyl-CoA dehydrogenase family protein [Alphaproteobacteria bacterium]